MSVAATPTNSCLRVFRLATVLVIGIALSVVWSSTARGSIITARSLMFSRSGSTDVRESTLSGMTWSASTSIFSMPSSPRWVVARMCPKRDEVAYATLDGNSDAYVWFKSGTTQGTQSLLTTSVATADSRAIAVGYEQISGDCLIVYSDNTALTTAYRTADNGVLSTQSLIPSLAPGTQLQIVQLYPRPNTNEIMLVGVASDNKLWGCIWNGASWGTPVTLTTNASTNASECFSAGYLPSGMAAVTYSSAGTNTVNIRTVTSGVWSGAMPLTGIGTDPRIIKIAGSPTSQNAVVGVLGGNGNLYAYTYNGVSVATPVTVATGIGTSTSRAFDVAWQPDGARAVVLYCKNAAAPSWKTFNGTAWSAESNGSTLTAGQTIRVISLTSGSSGADVYAICATSKPDLWAMTWTGATFNTPAIVESSLGGSAGDEPWGLSESLFGQKPTLTRWQQASP